MPLLNVINAQFHPIIRLLRTGRRPVGKIWREEVRVRDTALFAAT